MLSSYFSYWQGSRSDLLEFLTPSSKELEDLHLSFLRAYEDTYMANFFETVPMRIFGLPFGIVCDFPTKTSSPHVALDISFVEYCIELISEPLAPQVVTKESATIDGKPSVSVDADHRSLQRCETASTGNYLQIVHQINMAIEHLDTKSQ